MQIVHRPVRYTVLSLLVLLAIPIFILNLWIIQKGVVSKVLRPANLWWIAIQAIWVLATLRALLKAKWLGFWSFAALSAVMLITNVILLVSLKNYALAFYALFVLILSGMYSLHLFKNLNEPYYDSGQQWFEGTPRFLPHIEAKLGLEKQFLSVRLSRLGEEGCYAFCQSMPKVSGRGEIFLKLGNRTLKTEVELVSRSRDGFGWGLRFASRSADERKDIKDFIDRVRSVGYVS